MRLLRKFLVWTHRYLGMVLSLFFFMWFVTGIGMIYSRGMPRLTPQVRLARLAGLDWSRVRLSLSEAIDHAEIGERVRQSRLFTVMDRPAYRLAVGGGSVTVFADTGEVLAEAGAEEARAIAGRFMNLPQERIRYLGLLEKPDQWTLNQTREFPLHHLSVDDNAGTELYVSPAEAEVVQVSNRRSRRLAWISTIPHFLYFKSLRDSGALWNEAVVWTSGLGCILAAIGIVLGVLHFKPSRPFRLQRLSSYIPYTGWMRWHYITGVVFGVLTLTWVFSGLLSMEPWAWTQVDESLAAGTRRAFPAGPGDPSGFPSFDAARLTAVLGGRDVKEVEFVRLFERPHFVLRSAANLDPIPGPPDGGHQPYYVMRGTDPERLVVEADTLEVRRQAFTPDVLESRLKEVVPEAPVLESQMLGEYDFYYYSRDRQAPLPALRLKLGDPDKTWLYIDPEVNQVVGRVNRWNRLERWLYNGLHSLDFPFMYYRRPLWDAVIVVLSLGGAAVSGIGMLLGIKRIVRALRPRRLRLGDGI